MLKSLLLRAPDAMSGAPFTGARGASALRTDSAPTTPRDGAPRRLADLLAVVPGAELRGRADAMIRDVTYRSSAVRKGSLFFCVPGTLVDGHDFAAQADSAGAGAVVCQRPVAVRCPQVMVPSVRKAMGPMSAAFFGRSADRMTLIGVTGTNGKTTTTYLLESIFRAARLVPGVIGTTGVRIAGRPVPFDRTTPEAPDLQRLLADMLAEGVQAVAMEVSSHGLDQHRVDGTRYSGAIFTNLSQDHLDYHGTMDAYFEAKARLFAPEMTERAAVNADGPEGRSLAERADVPTLTFGLDDPAVDVRGERVELSSSGLSFDVGALGITSVLRGRFNVYNCLGAVVAARQVGVEDEAISQGIATLRGIPGRLEPVEAGQPYPVLVDYAHTPDSLDNVLRAARAFTRGRLIVVFGCGGDRDRGKRPLMGEAATRLADLSVLTSDNPRSEDPEAIIADIEAGARRGEGAFVAEPNRRAAIRLALAEAAADDVVVIAGKGHETGQQFADRTVPFDDRLVAAEEVASLQGSGPR